KLLSTWTAQEVLPAAARTDYKTNCRIVAATNRKPEEAIKAGKLREDLFYRISAIKQIFTQLARLDCFFGLAIGGGHNPAIGFIVGPGRGRQHFLCRPCAQQL